MTLSLLYRIADIINANSGTYHADVPLQSSSYMLHENNNLVRTECRTLHVTTTSKKPNIKSPEWNIYEIDMDNTIRKMSRRNPGFASRIKQGEPSLMDVELIIRRASFKSLKLRIANTSFDLYFNDNSDITQ